MARLTDRELQVMQESRVGLPKMGDAHTVFAPIVKEPANHDTVQLTKSEGAWLGYGSGLGKLVSRFAAYKERRRTISELNALDQHMLTDIGLERGDIVHFVNNELEADTTGRPARSGLFQSLRNWLLRRQTIRELETLDDRMLADIGIHRGIIREFVDEHLKAQSIVGPRPQSVGSEQTKSRLPSDTLRNLGYGYENFDWSRVVPKETAGSKTAA